MATTTTPVRNERQDAQRRRQQLIDAAIAAIAEQGLSKVTLAAVAGRAGLTAAMVNFHFDSKHALLIATLEHLAGAFQARMRQIAEAGGDPAGAITAIIELNFDPELASPRKVAVWYAFWGETQARADYLRIAGAGDRVQVAMLEDLVARLIRDQGMTLDPAPIAAGLSGLLDGLWQSILIEGDAFDRGKAIGLCRRYLDTVLPGALRERAAQPKTKAKPRTAPKRNDHRTLPAWTYHDPVFFQAELERVHLPAWHFICHASEIAEPGAYVTAELIGRRVFVVRGEDQVIRGFHNVCPHRAHAVVTGERGQCAEAIRCPYHAWTFALDGSLRAPAYPQTFPKLDKSRYSLKPVEIEIVMGLVFVRLAPGTTTIAGQLAPHAELLGHYRVADMVRSRPHWGGEVAADWKNVLDNFLECYHCPVGHPGLSCLMQADYANLPDDATRTALFFHDMRETPPWGWSQTHYNKLLPDVPHLPKELRRRWSYIFAYPGLTLNIYPDAFSVMVIRPLAPGRSWVGGCNYALVDERREMRAARFLNIRINSEVQREDVHLISSVQRGLESGVYDRGVLSDREVGVEAFHRWIAEDVPGADDGAAA